MKVLVIAPHMDDEVLGVGGTIAKHVERGDQVCVGVVANRAYGHRYEETAIEREQDAARRAQQLLGYQELRFLNLPDEQLDRALIDLIVPLERLYAEVRPEIVYTCHRGDSHQDHRAVCEASVVVCRAIAPYRPAQLVCYEVSSSTDQGAVGWGWQFVPNRYEALPASCVDKKLHALQCYERESRPFPHPRSLEGVRVALRKRGVEVGCEAAEAFMVMREIRA